MTFLMLACFSMAKAETVEIGTSLPSKGPYSASRQIKPRLGMNEAPYGIGTNSENYESYLPTYSLYKYSFTQQIYTKNELGAAKTINSISFYNIGVEKTRNLQIWLFPTEKSSFSDFDDWIKLPSAASPVFVSVPLT